MPENQEIFNNSGDSSSEIQRNLNKSDESTTGNSSSSSDLIREAIGLLRNPIEKLPAEGAVFTVFTLIIIIIIGSTILQVSDQDKFILIAIAIVLALVVWLILQRTSEELIRRIKNIENLTLTNQQLTNEIKQEKDKYEKSLKKEINFLETKIKSLNKINEALNNEELIVLIRQFAERVKELKGRTNLIEEGSKGLEKNTLERWERDAEEWQKKRDKKQ
jgi:hypothetical protein